MLHLTPPPPTPLGDIIVAVYTKMLLKYKDEELAAVATAAVVNDILLENSHVYS